MLSDEDALELVYSGLEDPVCPPFAIVFAAGDAELSADGVGKPLTKGGFLTKGLRNGGMMDNLMR